jgi:MFS superfamily sulfate permease-like transporter
MEFFAYGIANLFGSFFSAQLISASFSRTALNYEMNGQTRVAGFLRVVLCVLCLLFLMPFLSPLPKCVLAAVVWTAVYRLIRSGVIELKFLFCVSKLELIEFSVAVIAPLVIGMELGIFLAIATSIVVNLLRHTFAKVIFLGELTTTNKKNINKQNTTEYVDCKLFKECKVIPYVVIIEMKAELSFSNNLRLVNKIRQLLAAEERYIIVSLNLTSFIDTTAIRQIVTLFQDAQNAYICLSQCRPKVIELIRRFQSKMNDKFPPNVKTFISTRDAVIYLQRMREINVDAEVKEVSLTSECSFKISDEEATETSDGDSSKTDSNLLHDHENNM